MFVCWYHPKSTCFANAFENPSFRYRCLHIHNKLVQDGIDSRILHDIHDVKSIVDIPDVLLLSSFGLIEYQLTKLVKENGGKILHDYCENIRGIPILEDTKKLCDYLICCGTALQRKEAEVYGDKAICIPDPIEEPHFIKNHYYKVKKDKLKAVWSGMGGNALLPYTLLKPIVEDLGMEYIEISNRPQSNIKWDLSTWEKDMLSCDIALCPQAHWDFPMKSNVKVTAAMSLGLPVLASPIESYSSIIRQGENGYICQELDDWKNYLIELKDPEKRQKIAIKAFDALHPYRIDNVYAQWKKYIIGN